MTKQEQDGKTTIQIDTSLQTELNKLRKWRTDTYNTIIQRLLTGLSHVYVEFVLVDNELPQTHTVIFQIGEDPRNIFIWKGAKCEQIAIEEVQKLLKQSKPTLSVTRKEAEGILELFTTMTNMLPEDLTEFRERLTQFLKTSKDGDLLSIEGAD